MSSGMLDNYLIAQALGMDWNLWTMILLSGAEVLLFIGFVALCVIIDWYVKR